MVSSTRRRDFDDEEDFNRSIEKKSSANRTLLVLALAGAGLLLIVCVVSGLVMAVIANSKEATAAKLPGSWKGRFVLAGQPMDTIYTFGKDGSLREESFNLQGQRINIGHGSWRMRNGEIEIDWERGGFENATVAWIDEKTMNYRIVDHSQRIQIGMSTTFRRQ
jgi:hypothetical protein